MLALLTALVAACLPQETVERTYDLRALDAFAEMDESIPDPRLPLEAAYLDALEPWAEGLLWPGSGALPYGHWHEVIESLLLDEEVEGLDELRTYDGVLYADATEEVHAVIAELLADLETASIRDCTIEVHLFDPARIPADTPSVLDAERARALMLSTPSRGSQTLRARLERPAALDLSSRQALLYDYDVEVAQYSSVQDPQIMALSVGLLGGVMVDERRGGALRVRAWLRWGELQRPVRSIVSGEDGETVQLPSVDSMAAVMSADLPPGGALLLHGADLPHAVMIRARTAERAAVETERLVIVDVADSVERPFLVRPSLVSTPSPSGGWSWENLNTWSEDWNGADPAMEPVELEGVLREQLPYPSAVVGKRALVRVEGDARADVAERFADWTPPAAATYTIELRSGAVPLAQLDVFEGDEADAAVEALPLLAIGAAREGDSFALKFGVQSLYLRDYDIEVAQGAFAADPIIADVFDGASLWARVTDGSGDTVDLQYALSRAEVLEMGARNVDRNADTRSPGIQLPRARVHDLGGDQPTALDRWVHLETRSPDGESATVTYLRVREVTP